MRRCPQVYRFCEAVDAALQQVWEAGSGRVVAWCTDQPHRRTNAAVMAGAYLVLRCGFSADDAYTPFVGMRPAPLAMRDAAFGLCTFTLTLLDCLRGLDAARRQGIFAWETFDIASYEHDEQLSNGDLNWIVPGLFIAFSGPLDTVKRLADGQTTWHPRQYREFFRRNGVAAVVRLNKTCYDKSTFTRAGIAHYDLFYPDGGLAPPEILERFMHIAETTRGAVGVHCKAGLGRTGTCIGAHMMKHFRMTGREVIAWLRICRPGSVLGPQQQYLERLEPQMWRLGAEQGLPAYKAASAPPPPPPSASAPALARQARPHHRIVVVSPPSPTSPGAAGGSAAAAAAVGFRPSHGSSASDASAISLADGADAGPTRGAVAAELVAPPAPHPASSAPGAAATPVAPASGSGAAAAEPASPALGPGPDSRRGRGSPTTRPPADRASPGAREASQAAAAPPAAAGRASPASSAGGGSSRAAARTPSPVAAASDASAPASRGGTPSRLSDGARSGSRRRIGQIPRPLDLASPPLTPARSGEGAPATDGVHTPGHGRAVMPWPIRANRGGASGDSAPMGAPTPSASTAQGVEVDSMMSPGGSSHMQAHLVPRRGATASVGTEQEARAQAASGPGGFAPDARRTRSSRALGSRSRDSPLHRA